MSLFLSWNFIDEMPQLIRGDVRGDARDFFDWPDPDLRHKSESCRVKRRSQITLRSARRTVHPTTGLSTGSILSREQFSGARNECDEYYYSRVCLVIYPVGDDPFDVMLGVNGSGDQVVLNPSGAMPAYSKSDSISVVAYVFKCLYFPLQPMR